MQETQIQSLGQEDPLEKEVAATPGFMSGKSHGQRSLAGYSPWDCRELGTTEQLTLLLLSAANGFSAYYRSACVGKLLAWAFI